MNSGEQDKNVKYEDLPYSKQQWIDYKAVFGMVTVDERRTTADGNEMIPMRKMPIEEFAGYVGVTRQTLYNWQKEPGFWDLVNERRYALFGGQRLANVWNAVYLGATVKLYPEAQKMFLTNFDKRFKTPNTKVEVEASGGLLELLSAHKQKLRTDAAIEGNVVETETNAADNTAASL